MRPVDACFAPTGAERRQASPIKYHKHNPSLQMSSKILHGGGTFNFHPNNIISNFTDNAPFFDSPSTSLLSIDEDESIKKIIHRQHFCNMLCMC